MKFADDTTVVGLIHNNDESAYRDEIQKLTAWCSDNLILNSSKTKELVIDFRRKREEHAPIYIKGEIVEKVSDFKFLGTYISQDLTWSANTNALVIMYTGIEAKNIITYKHIL